MVLDWKGLANLENLDFSHFVAFKIVKCPKMRQIVNGHVNNVLMEIGHQPLNV